MMLDKRPFEPYWFVTWCATGPIIILVKENEKNPNLFSQS